MGCPTAVSGRAGGEVGCALPSPAPCLGCLSSLSFCLVSKGPDGVLFPLNGPYYSIQGHTANKSYSNETHPAPLTAPSPVTVFVGRGPKTYLAGTPGEDRVRCQRHPKGCWGSSSGSFAVGGNTQLPISCLLFQTRRTSSAPPP